MTSRKQLSQRKFDLTTPALRDNVPHFYADLSAPIETRKDKVGLQKVLVALDQLKLATLFQPSRQMAM